MKELAEAFASYLDHVSVRIMDRLGRTRNESDSTKKVRPIPAAVRAWFEECEQGENWDRLVAICNNVLGTESQRRTARWQAALKHWMRRGSTYWSLLDGIRPDPAAAAESFADATNAREGRVVYLALLDGVYFRGREDDVMDFGDFQVFRPTTTYLESLLGIPVNRIFYPRAVTSTERLINHWYLRLERRESLPPVCGMLYDPEMFAGAISPMYTEFHPAIETALKRLILCDQLGPREEFHPDGWVKISVPFIIRANENPLVAPPPAPPIENLAYQPALDADGEEVGEQPTTLIHLAAQQTAKFEQSIRNVHGQLEKIHSIGEQWQFVDLGLNYLIKGYFSEGIEQLIWHIISLEALLGEERTEIVERISTRVSALYSEDRERRLAAARDFKTLYEMRCSYVHGRSFKKQMDSNHLWKGRELAYTIAIRMLDLLSQLAEKVNAGILTEVPTRKQVLEMLYADGIRMKHPALSQVFLSASL